VKENHAEPDYSDHMRLHENRSMSQSSRSLRKDCPRMNSKDGPTMNALVMISEQLICSLHHIVLIARIAHMTWVSEFFRNCDGFVRSAPCMKLLPWELFTDNPTRNRTIRTARHTKKWSSRAYRENHLITMNATSKWSSTNAADVRTGCHHIKKLSAQKKVEKLEQVSIPALKENHTRCSARYSSVSGIIHQSLNKHMLSDKHPCFSLLRRSTIALNWS